MKSRRSEENLTYRHKQEERSSMKLEIRLEAMKSLVKMTLPKLIFPPTRLLRGKTFKQQLFHTSTSLISHISFPMPPTASDEAHQELLASLDVLSKPRKFRNPNWKPSSRRNKTVKQIIAEANRREASVMATQNNSGATTPALQPTNGAATPTNGATANLAQAAHSLSTLVLEKNLQARLVAEGVVSASDNATTAAAANGGGGGGNGNGTGGAGLVTYTSIEAAPSLHPAHAKPYCDITGLPAPYKDPKTRLRYHNAEVFQYIRTLPQGVAEMHLAARNAHVILK